jgi:hypothetical protein
MTTSEMAKIMGRKGGLTRAKRLSSDRRREIARLGVEARMESLRLAKRIQSNFDHLAAIYELRHAKA